MVTANRQRTSLLRGARVLEEDDTLVVHGPSSRSELNERREDQGKGEEDEKGEQKDVAQVA